LLFVAATAGGDEACRLGELSARIDRAAGPRATDIERLAWRDRLITDGDLGRALACISRKLEERTVAAFADALGYRSWATDGDIHLMPANDYSFGRVFANTHAASYASGSLGPLPEGSALIKETFIIGQDGTVTPGDVFLMVKGGASLSPWRGQVFSRDGVLSTDMAPCRSCHELADGPDGLFGRPWLLRTRQITPSR
jgi:hypothetical protein